MGLIPYLMKNIGLLIIRILNKQKDGGAKPYTHNVRRSNKIKDGLKIYSERETKKLRSQEKKLTLLI